MIAKRCLSSEVAETLRYYTCYSMETAGSEGFLNLLPIYLDHLLNPTLNDSFFITEVGSTNFGVFCFSPCFQVSDMNWKVNRSVCHSLSWSVAPTFTAFAPSKAVASMRSRSPKCI